MVNTSATQSRNQSCTTEINEKLSLTAPITTKDAILQSRDLLVLGYRLNNDRMEQTRLLDLLEIFNNTLSRESLVKLQRLLLPK